MTPDEKEKEFITLKVKLLFRRLEEGKVKLVAENIPNAVEALKAVQFDSAGDPVYETITEPVRAMANVVYSREVQKLDKELEERERDSPVHNLLGLAVKVDDEAINIVAKKMTLRCLPLTSTKKRRSSSPSARTPAQWKTVY
jgi:hypothetical protein